MNKHLRHGRCNGAYIHGIISTPPACDGCPLRYKAHKKVLPDGPVPARLAFVGEEPGNTEERKGRGFIGPSGALLWDHYGKHLGFKREDVWVTNAILCKSEKVKLASGAVLQREDVQEIAAKYCKQRLIDELLTVDPVVIIPLGNIAMRSLTGMPHAKIYGYRGSRIELDLRAASDTIRQHGIK